MATLTVGNTDIAYSVRASDRTKRMRIEVTPETVVVVTPPKCDAAHVDAFIRRKRKWVFTKQVELQERAGRIAEIHPTRFVTGAKIPYRGRRMPLRVTREPGRETTELGYRNGFNVTCGPDTGEEAIGYLIECWLRRRVETDVRALVRRYERLLGVEARSVQVKEFQHLWGSCGKDGSIRINWRLIFAPKPVLEYVVVHELAHLIERNHSPKFWRTVAGILPDYERPKAWLDRFGMEL